MRDNGGSVGRSAELHFLLNRCGRRRIRRSCRRNEFYDNEGYDGGDDDDGAGKNPKYTALYPVRLHQFLYGLLVTVGYFQYKGFRILSVHSGHGIFIVNSHILYIHTSPQRTRAHGVYCGHMAETTRPQQSGRESTPEFHEETERMMERMAESIRTERESPSAERNAGGEKRDTAAELEKIREKLRMIHAEHDARTADSRPPGDDAHDTGHLSAVDEAYRERVGHLVALAIQDGIPAALDSIRKMNDPYLMDAFHDSLAEVLHKKMHANNLL